MRRRDKAGRKAVKSRRHKTLTRRKASKARPPRGASAANLQEQVAALTGALKNAREQQTAASEVLRVISSSPGELQPVFDTMLANAVRICEAKFGIMHLHESGGFRLAAAHGTPAALTEHQRSRGLFQPRPGTPLDILWRTKEVARIDDESAASNPSALATFGGARAHIAVPMLKDNELIGAIAIYRQEARPFTDEQVNLVKNFATQAVIAIENTRLFNELRQRTDDLSESLEQQTATSEVLKVISSSPGQLEPVFEAILANATDICEAKFANLFLYADNSFCIAAQQNPPPAYAERWRKNPALTVSDNPHNPLTR